MADCQHTGRHLHCNICGGAPCADCFGSIAPSEPIKFGPTIKKDFPSTIAALRAQLEQAKAERDDLMRDATALEELRKVIAEAEGRDVNTWPGHGNKALAIAAQYTLNLQTIARQREWIESAGHRPGCKAITCQYRLRIDLTPCGQGDFEFPHVNTANPHHHKFQPGPCDCGYAELVSK